MNLLRTELSNPKTIEQDLLNTINDAISLEVLIVSSKLATESNDHIIIKDPDLLDQAQRLLDRYITQGIVSSSLRSVGRPNEIVFREVVLTELGQEYLEKLNHPVKHTARQIAVVILSGNGLIAALSSGVGAFLGNLLIKYLT